MSKLETEEKDALTEVVEEIQDVSTPEENLEGDINHVVLDGNGEEVTLGEEAPEEGASLESEVSEE